MKVVIVNGQGRSGKDTFCDLCGYFTNVHKYSSVDEIKRMARLAGWDGKTKDEKTRKFLSDLKFLCSEYSDMPMRLMKEKFNSLNGIYEGEKEQILFLMSRECEEIYRAKQELNAITLLIRNPNIAKIFSNSADANVEEYQDKYGYDSIINNDGTLDDLKAKASEFVYKIIGG